MKNRSLMIKGSNPWDKKSKSGNKKIVMSKKFNTTNAKFIKATPAYGNKSIKSSSPTRPKKLSSGDYIKTKKLGTGKVK